MYTPGWTELRQIAQEEIDRLLLELPRPFLEQVRHIPVVLKKVPSRELIEEGLDSDLLGLFVGDDFVHEGSEPMPPEILLFLHNLWEEAEGDPERYRQEIRTTLLHELGHYLGLDEDDLFDRGLE
jgi:predicted Zn-dependent protease with MMP-like domain